MGAGGVARRVAAPGPGSGAQESRLQRRARKWSRRGAQLSFAGKCASQERGVRCLRGANWGNRVT
eukprot:6790114-Pyramimonas_sp.AAC.1